MASKFEVSNNSPGILDSSEKSPRTYLNENSQTQQKKKILLNYYEHQTPITESSVLNLKQKFNLRPDVSLHIRRPQKLHASTEKALKIHKYRNNKRSKAQKSYPFIDKTADTHILWNSEKTLTSKTVNILDERGNIDHVDVLSLKGKSTHFSSGVAFGLVGIFFVVLIVFYWIKNVIFGITKQNSANHKSSESAGFVQFHFEKKTNLNKEDLVVFHKRVKKHLSTKVITRYSSNLVEIMDIDAEESNIDASHLSSNKSTPYFTPLGTLDEGVGRFEFPLPSPPSTSLCSNEEVLLPITPTISSTCARHIKNSTDLVQSPTRRLRRCSLYERRSCSPQRSPNSNLVTNRPLCKSQVDSYEQHYNSPTISSNPIHSTISPTGTPGLVDVSSRQFSNNKQISCSPKTYENRAVDIDYDKENEIPIGSELYSPKLKTSDLVLFQQNSPRILESSPTPVTHFSFPPNTVDRSEIICVGSNYTALKYSPSISSAGYKNGDYFKFPEVDCFSPDTNKISSSVDYNHFEKDELQSIQLSSSLQEKVKVGNSIDCQATRRARLKSISLDSEGAKLVEDNLGVPVEELIERSSPVVIDFFAKNSPHQSTHYKTIATHQTSEQNLQSSQVFFNNNKDRLEYPHKLVNLLEPNPTKTHTEYKRKNKYNLTLSIENYSNINQNEVQEIQQKINTPKTPKLLVQSKQKAISLDSSDSNFSPSRRSIKEQNECAVGSNTSHRPMAMSLLHISSLSMPASPKKQLSLNKDTSYLNRSKLASHGGQTSKGRHFSTSKSLTPSTSSFDPNRSLERQGFILKLDSFNENTMDTADYDKEGTMADEEDDDNYFWNFDDVPVINEDIASGTPAIGNTIHVSFPISTVTTIDGEDKLSSANIKKLSPDCLLGTTLQTQKCTTVLSLSNSNLKTLPEVMTLSDFSIRSRDDEIRIEKGSTLVAGHNPLSVLKQSNLVSGRTVRSSLLQRRGSNHSLTLNLNGSYGSLSKGLSTSNYSLSSNSQCNLSNSIYNLSQNQPGPFKTGQALLLKGNPVFIQNSNVITNVHHGLAGATKCSGIVAERKNLLQRRGSNTSLTLNIHGSPCINLNRFNSHSSLNITSQQHQNAFKMYHQLKDANSTQCENSENAKTKKGLLERRGSNASLTINLHSNALAVSNINLRGSACSLSSINTTQLEEEYEGHDHQEHAYSLNMNSNTNTSGSVGQNRKFFSSENLNNLNGMTQYSKLNQAHMRSSTKTCFGSVSDLKPYCQLPLSLIIGEDHETHFKNQFLEPKNALDIDGCLNLQNNKENLPGTSIPSFKQTNLCSCTGVRNITTRPLSPQTTSEDFKIYLANIQLLQNASNILNEYDLMKLNYMFDKSYGNEVNDPENIHKIEAFEENHWKLILRSEFQFELPMEDEQKRLLRNLHQEFWDLPTNHQEKPMVFGSQAKNRYKSILPNEHSRVQLLPEDETKEAPYINANYIKGPDYVQKSYIATQGPLPNTIYDFWLMVFQNISKYDEQKVLQSAATPIIKNLSRSELVTPSFQSKLSSFKTELENDSSFKSAGSQQKIVMLTNFVENCRQKCSAYFPVDENEMFIVTYTNDQIKNPEIDIFYNQYFERLNKKQSVFNIETFRIEINDKKLIENLPKVNYFIIKNMGIIIRNGFSIRQLHCLYCCNITNINNLVDTPVANDNIDEKRIQLVHRFNSCHYWYPDWPDHRSPNDISVLLEISQHLLELENSDNQPLPIIHCSAGIGRTGCMAAILNAICQIRASISSEPLNSITSCSKQMTYENIFKNKKVTNSTTRSVPNDSNTYNIKSSNGNTSDVDNLQSYPSQSFPYNNVDSSNKTKQNSKAPSEDLSGYVVQIKDNFFHERGKKMYCEAIKTNPRIYVDILGIVCNLRLQRGGMVQNSEQYELVHRAMCLYLKRVLKYLYETQM